MKNTTHLVADNLLVQRWSYENLLVIHEEVG